jgi:bifunctional non-homologous end joining protein LigD
LCFIDRGRASLISRHGNDLTRLCPGVSADRISHPRCSTVRSWRSGVGAELRGAPRRDAPSGVDDVTFLFDLLWLRGRSLQRTPYTERREELEALPFQAPVALSPRFDDGQALFEQTLRQGYEGVVAKRRRSMYHPGVRTRDWIKTKVEEFPDRRLVSATPRAGVRTAGRRDRRAGSASLPRPGGIRVHGGGARRPEERLASLARRTAPFTEPVHDLMPSL